jgi:hypothetical protein
VAAATIAGVTLGSCSDIYTERRHTIALTTGEATAANRVTFMIDPWPPASPNRKIAYDGEKAARAAECYRLGRVIPPANPTTSSAAYTQAQQAAQAGCNSPAPAAKAAGGTNP